MFVRIMFAAVLAVLGGCGEDSDVGDPAIFPADYADTYQEVRACRRSLDHGLVYIRVLAAPEALVPYTGRVAPFPTGAIVLKEQYGEDDATCAGPIVHFTVMQKLEVGSSPETLGWVWQHANADLTTAKSENTAAAIKHCTGCHAECQLGENKGYDGTCTDP